MTRPRHILPCLLAAAIATACAPLPTIKVSGAQTRAALLPHAHKASMLDAGQAASRPCELIGIVSAIGDPKMANPLVPRATSWRARRRMRKIAGKIGADALIDYRAGKAPPLICLSRRSWSGAVAVRFLSSPGPSAQTNQIGIVLVAAPESSDTEAVVARELAAASGYYLAEKGYLPVIPGSGAAWDPAPAALAAGSSREPQSGPAQPEYVLCLRLKHRESKMLRATGYVEAALVDKVSGETVWKFPSGETTGIRLVDFNGLDSVAGFHAVLCDVFNTLPDRTTRAFFSLRNGDVGPMDVLFE